MLHAFEKHAGEHKLKRCALCVQVAAKQGAPGEGGAPPIDTYFKPTGAGAAAQGTRPGGAGAGGAGPQGNRQGGAGPSGGPAGGQAASPPSAHKQATLDRFFVARGQQGGGRQQQAAAQGAGLKRARDWEDDG